MELRDYDPEQCWRQRIAYVSAGSAGGHPEFKVAGFPAARATKRYDAACRDRPLEAELRDHPRCTGVVAMAKPNDLKPRSLYVVDTLTTELEGIAITPFERSFTDPACPVMSATEDRCATMLRAATMTRQHLSSYDFDDFNSQHSLENLRAVVNAVYDLIAERTVNRPDLVERLRRLSLSVIGHPVEYPHAVGETGGGLFSGWRFTTLANTMLNVAYTSAMCRLARCQPTFQYHAGDDYVAMIPPDEYRRFLAAGDQLGVRANRDKQIYLCGRCEWLRKTYYPSGRAFRSLSRVIASSVAGNWGTPHAPHSDAAAATLREQTMLLFYARGADEAGIEAARRIFWRQPNPR